MSNFLMARILLFSGTFAIKIHFQRLLDTSRGQILGSNFLNLFLFFLNNVNPFTKVLQHIIVVYEIGRESFTHT